MRHKLMILSAMFRDDVREVGCRREHRQGAHALPNQYDHKSNPHHRTGSRIFQRGEEERFNQVLSDTSSKSSVILATVI